MQHLSEAKKQFIAESLEAYLKSSQVTLREVSRRTKVDISQISRYRRGQFCYMNRNLRRLCNFASIDVSNFSQTDPKSSQVLMDALTGTWDGSDHHAKAIAQTIRTLKNYHA